MFEDGWFSGLPSPVEPEFLPGDETEWYFDEETGVYLAEGWEFESMEYPDSA